MTLEGGWACCIRVPRKLLKWNMVHVGVIMLPARGILGRAADLKLIWAIARWTRVRLALALLRDPSFAILAQALHAEEDSRFLFPQHQKPPISKLGKS